jgi:hypothetical protein
MLTFTSTDKPKEENKINFFLHNKNGNPMYEETHKPRMIQQGKISVQARNENGTLIYNNIREPLYNNVGGQKILQKNNSGKILYKDPRRPVMVDNSTGMKVQDKDKNGILKFHNMIPIKSTRLFTHKSTNKPHKPGWFNKTIKGWGFNSPRYYLPLSQYPNGNKPSRWGLNFFKPKHSGNPLFNNTQGNRQNGETAETIRKKIEQIKITNSNSDELKKEKLKKIKKLYERLEKIEYDEMIDTRNKLEKNKIILKEMIDYSVKTHNENMKKYLSSSKIFKDEVIEDRFAYYIDETHTIYKLNETAHKQYIALYYINFNRGIKKMSDEIKTALNYTKGNIITQLGLITCTSKDSDPNNDIYHLISINSAHSPMKIYNFHLFDYMPTPAIPMPLPPRVPVSPLLPNNDSDSDDSDSDDSDSDDSDIEELIKEFIEKQYHLHMFELNKFKGKQLHSEAYYIKDGIQQLLNTEELNNYIAIYTFNNGLRNGSLDAKLKDAFKIKNGNITNMGNIEFRENKYNIMLLDTKYEIIQDHLFDYIKVPESKKGKGKGKSVTPRARPRGHGS